MPNKKVCDSWSATQRIDEGLYLITEPHYYWYNRANLWLIKGRDQDLLIDTGLGVASLRQHLQAGDVLDWGDRALEVLHLPGHSAGCIALYDHRSQALFAGDVIYDGELLDELHCSNIPDYINTYERLQKLPVDTVYSGHYQTFGKDRYLEILGEYLDRRRQPGCPHEIAHKSSV
jgi:glyoxylase-like metal-dependent hydrolase (beta-lactamase superfamily II)